MFRHLTLPRGAWLLSVGLVTLGVTQVEAGGLFRKRARSVTPTVRTAPPPNAAPLGTFVPTPYVVVRGNFPIGGGYSPNNSFGDTSMDIYGPLSAFRSTSAPVPIYERGYNGSGVITEATAFSTPNFAAGSPVVYPTQATNYYGFREMHEPPWWPRAINWIDQN